MLTEQALAQHDRNTYRGASNNDLFKLDPDERKEMEDLFNTYNVSGTGELSLEEFTHLFQDLGLQDVEQAMKILDTKGTGTITKLEFMRWFFQPEVIKDAAANAQAQAQRPVAKSPSPRTPSRHRPAPEIKEAPSPRREINHPSRDDSKHTQNQIKKVDANFSKYDRGNKGYLRSEELERFLIDFGLSDSHERRLAKDLIDANNNGKGTKQDIINWCFGNSNMIPTEDQSRSRTRSISGVSSYSGAYSSGGTWTPGSKSVATKTTMGDYDRLERMNRARRKTGRGSVHGSVASGASIASGITLHNMGADDERARRIFEIIDKNQDGMIDIRDFHSAVERLGLRWDKRHTTKVFNILDIDAMRNVDFDTFVTQLKTDDPHLRCMLNRLLFDVDPQMDMDPDDMTDPTHAGERMDPTKVQKLMSDLKAGWEERCTAIHSLADILQAAKGDKFHRLFKKNLNGWITQLTDGRSTVLRECCLSLAKVVKNRKREMQKYLPRLFDAMFALLRVSGVESIRASANLWFRAVVKYIPDNKKYVLISQVIKGTKDPKYTVVRQYCFDYIVLLLNKARITGRPTDSGWWDKVESAIRDGIKDSKEIVKKSVYDALVRLDLLYPERAQRIVSRMKGAQISRYEEKQQAYSTQMSRLGMFESATPPTGLAAITGTNKKKMRSQLMAFLANYEKGATGRIVARDLNRVFQNLGVPLSILEKKLSRCKQLLEIGDRGVDVTVLVDWWFQDSRLSKLKIPKPGKVAPNRQRSLTTPSAPVATPPKKQSRPTTPSRGGRSVPIRKQRKASATKTRPRPGPKPNRVRASSSLKPETRPRRGSRGSVGSRGSRGSKREPRSASRPNTRTTGSRTFGPRPMPRQAASARQTPQKKLGPRRPQPRERSPAKAYDRYGAGLEDERTRTPEPKRSGRATSGAARSNIKAEASTDNFGNVLSEILEVRSVLSQVENQIQSISNFTNSFGSSASKSREQTSINKQTPLKMPAPQRSEREKKISKAAHRRMNSVRTQVRQVESIVENCDKGQKGYLSMMEMRKFLNDFGVGAEQIPRALATIRKQQGRAKKSELVQWALNEAPKQDWGRWKEIIGFSDMIAASMPNVDENTPSKSRSSARKAQAPQSRDQTGELLHQHSREVLLEINNSGFPDVPSNGSSPYHSTESNGAASADANKAGWAQLTEDQLGTRLQFYHYLLEVESEIGNSVAVRELRQKINTIKDLLKDKGKDPADYENSGGSNQHLTEKPGIIKTSLKGSKGKEVKDIIKKLRLVKANHGGLQAEACRSNDQIIMPRTPKSSGVLGNSINYILEGENMCHWHRIPSDQTWAFHKGCELLIYTLDELSQQVTSIRLGDVLSRNKAVCQFHISAGMYVAAELSDKEDYALISIHNFPAVEPNSIMPVSISQWSAKFPGKRDLLRLCN